MNCSRVFRCFPLAPVLWLVQILCLVAHAAEPAKTRPDIVSIYFPGYHQDDHYDSWFGEGWNEWQLLGDAPTRFPGQKFLRPAWGNFDEADPGWMSKQVTLAAEHGIDVFLFDWYWYSGVKILYRPLEEGFLRATNQLRLKFALMWANHDWKNYFPAPKDSEPTLWLPWRTTPKDFARVIEYCREKYFGRTNYWRVQGGLYFGVFDPDNFVQQLGGPAPTRQVLEEARRRIRSAGLGEMHFAAFAGAPERVATLRAAGFDSATTYNVTASGKASLEHPLDDYRDLVDAHRGFWQRMDTGLLPYFPVVTVGWDCTPRWEKDAPFPPKRGSYPYGSVVVSNTPAELRRLCELARQHVQQARVAPNAILINAWNEWTEGSALLPEKDLGTAYLDALTELKAR